MDNFKKTAMWTGIVLTGLCGIVLLGAGKVKSGTLLITMTFIMILPAGRRPKLPRWVSVGLICAAFGFVIWNISTTDLPSSMNVAVMGCENAHTYTSTGFKFLDQVTYLFNGFLSRAESS